MGEPSDEQARINSEWRAFLMGENPWYHRYQRMFHMLPTSPRCKVCYAPFRGPGGVVMRALGRSPAKMNPRICGLCERFVRAHHGGAEIPLSLLFADVRGSTSLAEQLGTAEFSALIARFYDAVTDELIKANALVDRLIGDEAVALFVPVMVGEKHAESAVQAARAILKATGHEERAGPWIPVGIGVHTGSAFVGAIGTSGVTDITALGDDVNLTARLASAASAGEIIVTDATRAAAGLPTERLKACSLELKGRSAPVDVWVMHTGLGVAK